jgi:hypothetical protein
MVERFVSIEEAAGPMPAFSTIFARRRIHKHVDDADR